MDKKNLQSIVVGAIVIDQGKILIVQRSQAESIFPGLWELPSGKVEVSEKLEEALARELKEETNLEADILQEIGSFDYQILKQSKSKKVRQINFLLKAKNTEQIKLSKEHQAYRWIGKDQINDFDISDKIKKVLQQAFDKGL